ncbi:MAG: hypothetical protein IKA55_02160 [Akkermansia sp.]|nr:hypothetical protein [Akkermansia sp.]
MSEFTVDISELHEVGCVGLELTAASRAADVVQLEFVSDVVGAVPVPWVHGDCVTLMDGEAVLARGWVLDCGVQLGAASYGFSVQLGNVVALMDAVPYTEGQGFRGYVQDERRLVSAAAMVRLLAEAGMKVPGGGDSGDAVVVDFDAEIKCPTGSGSQSCWSLVEEVLHWVPDAVSFYEPDARRLSFCRAGERDELVIDVAAGVGLIGDEVVLRFGVVDRAEFRPRFDLCPPVVGMVWGEGEVRQKFVLPEGGDLRQPWAFLYEVPEVGGAAGDGGLSDGEVAAVRKAAAQRMEVEGVPVPVGWVTMGDMREVSAAAPKLAYDFWCRWFPPLKRTGIGCLGFGQPVFEPVEVDVAFPPVEGGATSADGTVETGQPANYEEFSEEKQRIYVLNAGSFPASADKRDNVSGLNFCHGVYKQYVWLKSDYIGTLSVDERREFFKGSWSVQLEDGGRHATRYVLLTLRAVFIDRHHKRFRTGTNELVEGDEDYVLPGDDSAGDDSAGDVGSTADYRQAVRDYYRATRRLMWDGCISLVGVEGVCLNRLVGCALSVKGLRDEWVSMGTPVQAVAWRPFEGVLSLQTGSMELLSVDERVERMRLGRHVAAGAGTSMPPEKEPDEGSEEGSEGDDGDGDDAVSDFPMVSPSVAANQEARAEGRPLNPFEVFQEGDKWFMNEGVWPAFGELLQWPTTDVTDKKAMYDKLGIDVDFDESGKPVLVVRGYGKKAGTGGDA